LRNLYAKIGRPQTFRNLPKLFFISHLHSVIYPTVSPGHRAVTFLGRFLHNLDHPLRRGDLAGFASPTCFALEVPPARRVT
jgi:hypothetical protein